MAKIQDKSVEKEIDRAMRYISIGSAKIFKEDDEINNIKDRIKGVQMVQSGANILNSLSKIKGADGGPYFPSQVKEVLSLIKAHSVDEWVEMYPFLKDNCNDLVNNRTNFYDQAFLDKEDRDIIECSEFDLYVKFNNDIAFSEVRNIARNDSEYSFTRAYIPPVLEGELLDLKQSLRFKYIELYGESISDDILNKVLMNYYKPINNLKSFYSENGKYAICKSCGSLMKKRQNGKIVCSFDRCETSHYMKNKAFEILGYCTNPTRMLKYEIMRFVYFPSIEERLMFDRLDKKYQRKSLIRELILYKGKDTCDISFYIGNDREAIDLKEWENPEHLAKALNADNFRRNNADANCTIVVPDYLTRKSNGRKNDYMKRLKSAITGDKMRDVQIMTVSEFFTYLDRRINK